MRQRAEVEELLEVALALGRKHAEADELDGDEERDPADYEGVRAPVEHVAHGLGEPRVESTGKLSVALRHIPANPGQRVGGEQPDQQSGEDEEHEGPEEKAGERLAGHAAHQPQVAAPPLPHRPLRAPVEVGGDLDDLRPHYLRLVDDLRVDLGVTGLGAQRLDERPVVAANHPAQGGQMPLGGKGQQGIRCPAEELPPPRNRGGSPSLGVGRGDHDFRSGFDRSVEESADVFRPVAEVGVERDDVVAPGVVEGEAERLPEVEVVVVVKGPHPGIGSGEAVDQLPGAVPAAVVDDDDLPGIAPFDGGQVGDHAFQRGGDDRLLVAGGDDDRDERCSSHVGSPAPWVFENDHSGAW